MLSRCPQCGNEAIRPARPRGLLEALLSFCLLTVHCQICKHRRRRFHLGRKGSPKKFDRRDYERLPAMLPTVFSGKEVQGRGVIADVSAGGCWITSDKLAKKGMLLHLHLLTHEDEPPIEVDAAVVRMTLGLGFGCEFIRVRPQQKKRLQWLLEKFWRERHPQDSGL